MSSEIIIVPALLCVPPPHVTLYGRATALSTKENRERHDVCMNEALAFQRILEVYCSFFSSFTPTSFPVIKPLDVPLRTQEDLWAFETATALERAQNEHGVTTAHMYSPYHCRWMPHELLRPVYDEWKAFFAVRRLRATYFPPSAIAAAFLITVLVGDGCDGDEISEEAFQLGRRVSEVVLEVVTDSEDEDAVSSMPYTTFLAVVRHLADCIYAPRHSVGAAHLLAKRMHDQLHRLT
jgi:hypothetical protein